MNLNLSGDEHNIYMKKVIKIILISTVVFSLLSIIGLFFSYKIYLPRCKFLYDIKAINGTLSIISVASCWIYYYIYKKQEFLLVTLLFLSLAAENIFMGLIQTNFRILRNMFCISMTTPYILRTFLITLTVIKNSKTAEFIETNKIVTSIAIIFFSIALSGIEVVYRLNQDSEFSRKITVIINILIIIYYFIILGLLAKKSVVQNEIIYTIIIGSINCFTIRRMYAIKEYFTGYNINLQQVCNIFTFIGFSVLVIGLFSETKRKVQENEKINKELVMNENKLLSVTENIKDLIITIDIHDKIVYVNNAVIKTLGYSKKELIGATYSHILKSEDCYLDIADFKRNRFIEHKIKCKNNNILNMESIHSVISNENGNVVGHVVVSRDLSYRQEFEIMKEKYNEIKEYDKIRTDFFANLSHEVRTPIHIIYSCVQLLNNSKASGHNELWNCYNKYEKTIKQNCYRMLKLVNNLLDITKLDSGFIKTDFKNYNIVNLVEDITLSVVPYVEVKKINIVFDTEIEELYIKCDKDKIERIILNLLSNAIKFTEVGGNILVYISLEGEYVKIRVKDDGIGIPHNFRKFIFERFMQTDKSFNRKKEGTGIGLALVKSLVELHNGQVYVEDNGTENGSEFVVDLPNIKIESTEEDSKGEEIEGDDKKKRNDKIHLEFSDIYDLVE